MPNVALVVLDTLRKDYFDQHFDWLPGRRFENAWSTSHWTVPSHASMFTGKYPSEAGSHNKSVELDYPDDVLAEHLQDAGYMTRAFSANTFISPKFRFTRGFQEFVGIWRHEMLENGVIDWYQFVKDTDKTGPARYLEAVNRIRTSDHPLDSLKNAIRVKLNEYGYGPDDDGVTTAIEHVRNSSFGDREFYFANLMEVHAPYDPPSEYARAEYPIFDNTYANIEGEGPDPEQMQRAYAGAAEYLSVMYKKLFDELKQNFDYIITCADHGECLGEHGAWEHAYGLYPEITHVPLVVSGEGFDGTVEQPVSLLDIHQTILDLAGVDAPSRGRSLLSTAETNSHPLLVEYHGFNPQQIEGLRNKVSEEVIDHYNEPLDGVVLPPSYYGYETHDGWQETAEMSVSDPQKQLESLRDSLDVREVSNSTEVSKEVRSHLEDLGYA